ncbi:MAG: toxin-antitoxin system YwqK family antitoxin [Bacteroidetes bacterium]|nr:toxin-antitoxin system YwqK family antitoxin [Bacteroidota bacterium]
MTREEHIAFCKKCLNRNFDSNKGLICSLTGEIADFEENCESFKLDESVKAEVKETTIVNTEELTKELDGNKINKLRIHQDFTYAIIGGTLAAIISAIIWAVVTVLTNYQIGYMAIGVGLLVGFSIQFFGAGIDKKFGYLGAILSLLGCLLGNLFSQVGFAANEQSSGYLEIISFLNFDLILDILIESFNPMDLLFYGIAIYIGFKNAFRRVSDQELRNLQSEESYAANPSNYKLRMPLIIVSIVLIGLFLFLIRKEASRFKTFTYESGNKMSEGEMKDSKEHGKWTYWHENGEIQLIAIFSDGIQDSLWQWFDESGHISRIGTYRKGIEHGIWMNYYKNGIVSDSGNFHEGRMDGEWKYKFENGNTYQIGYFNRNLQDSIWKTYFENGQLKSVVNMHEGIPVGLWTTYHMNGKISGKVNYLNKDKNLIEDVWDLEGNHIVVSGNGLFKSFSNTGQVLLQGNIKDGEKIGEWISYFENGDTKEEGIYEGDMYKIINSWVSKSEQTVKDGQGTYISNYPDKGSIFESGKIENGLREGIWKTYYESTGSLDNANNYLNGKLTGTQKYYYESGQLYFSGEMKNGLREGEWVWYYENGNISSSVNFINDKKEGLQNMWSETGEKPKKNFIKTEN